MGDGWYIKASKTLHFGTDCFSITDIDILQKKLLSKYTINSRIHKSNVGQPRLIYQEKIPIY
jgi:hypothetical protein